MRPTLGAPALVFDQQGKVFAANSLIESKSTIIHWRAFDCVSLQDRRADQMLRSALAGLKIEDGSSVRSFPVHDIDDSKFIAHVIPIRLSARDIFVRCAAVFTMTPVTAPDAPPVELVQSLFDLTPMEARVARGLAAGKDVETIATERGVSRNTIRTHVRGVLEKTGCNRQTDVVALLGGISRPPNA
jgi:DNA-binding CsgD family transcriptional regulator